MPEPSDGQRPIEFDASPGGAVVPAEDSVPWFISEVFREGDLTPAQLAAVQDLVAATYRDLVLQEKNSLLRATGNMLVFQIFLEALLQPEVAAALREALCDPEHKRAEFENRLRFYLALTAERNKATTLILKLRKPLHQYWPGGDPLRAAYKRGQL